MDRQEEIKFLHQGEFLPQGEKLHRLGNVVSWRRFSGSGPSSFSWEETGTIVRIDVWGIEAPENRRTRRYHIELKNGERVLVYEESIIR